MMWLLDTLQVGEGILDALWFWLDELVPGLVGRPLTVNPDESGLSHDQDLPESVGVWWAKWGTTTLC